MAAPDSATPPTAPGARWQQVLRDAVRDLDELAALLEIPAAALRARAAEHPDFALLVPRGFVAKMARGDLDDPLLRQILPLQDEQRAAPGFSGDPLEERGLAAGGVIRKYRGRALLIASGACPVHCRYCFRRAFPYAEQLAARAGFEPALAQLGADRDVEEVILSGGDPLSLSNARLRALFDALAALPRLESVRIHTRYPVMVPERVDAGLTRLIADAGARVVVVIHCNHPREIDAEVAACLETLAGAAHCVLNQSVLLDGVNDDAATLIELSRRLFACRVLPYYLHLLDPVEGAAHFDVDAARARRLVDEVRARLPGYLVPKLVREIPGGLSKSPV